MQDLKRQATMGRFSVEFVISNHRDVVAAELGNIPPDQVRRATLQGLVDTGATYLVLPAAVVKQLGLPRTSRMKVRYADGRQATRDVVSEVQVDMLGRQGTFRAVVEPKRQEALIGAIVLEDLDLLPDCTNRRLVPRDPNIMLGEIE
ncbi:MAG TPA: retroviral-like aspartic protease family protein [Gemmataceae bacterium]|nr:retroviral-like aspartic protease family protein [Gemmataceae bacterium]